MRTALLSSVLVSICLHVYAVPEFVESKVLVRIVDDSGAPLVDASVSFNSYTNPPFISGYTDSNGVFSYRDRIRSAISCYASKPGYYETHGEVWVGPMSLTDSPVGVFTVVVKRISHPSPLVLKHIDGLYLPLLNEPVGFDFAIGDWVLPYGKGKTEDVWVTGQFRRSTPKDYDIQVILVFSNIVDGCQSFTARNPQELYLASDLMPPQEAPLSGYTNIVRVFNKKRPGAPTEESCVPNRNSIFRIRTKVSAANEVLSANVGWTIGDIKVGADKTGRVGLMFDYYFNPDPTSRSLEPLDADKSKYR